MWILAILEKKSIHDGVLHVGLGDAKTGCCRDCILKFHFVHVVVL